MQLKNGSSTPGDSDPGGHSGWRPADTLRTIPEWIATGGFGMVRSAADAVLYPPERAGPAMSEHPEPEQDDVKLIETLGSYHQIYDGGGAVDGDWGHIGIPGLRQEHRFAAPRTRPCLTGGMFFDIAQTEPRHAVTSPFHCLTGPFCVTWQFRTSPDPPSEPTPIRKRPIMTLEPLEAGSKKRETVTFLILAVLIWPFIAVGVVAGWGFVVWMYYLFTGPPGPV
jgi:periplasmic nitrate reductase NapE